MCVSSKASVHRTTSSTSDTTKLIRARPSANLSLRCSFCQRRAVAVAATRGDSSTVTSTRFPVPLMKPITSSEAYSSGSVRVIVHVPAFAGWERKRSSANAAKRDFPDRTDQVKCARAKRDPVRLDLAFVLCLAVAAVITKAYSRASVRG